MIKPDLTESFEYGGKTIGCEWFDADTMDKLPDVSWQQVYAIAKLDGKVPVVIYEDAHANLPGGKTEAGETIEQTLRREIQEELNCQVVYWEPVGYQKLEEPGLDHPLYQLRVYAVLAKIGEFERDSGGDVVGHRLVEINVLNKTINYGKIGERIVDLLRSHY